MSYEKAELSNETKMVRAWASGAAAGIGIALGAKNIKTHTTQEVHDDGHFGETVHITGTGPTVAAFAVSVAIALGPDKLKKIARKSVDFARMVFTGAER